MLARRTRDKIVEAGPVGALQLGIEGLDQAAPVEHTGQRVMPAQFLDTRLQRLDFQVFLG